MQKKREIDTQTIHRTLQIACISRSPNRLFNEKVQSTSVRELKGIHVKLMAFQRLTTILQC